MSTITDKRIVDGIIAGEYEEDGWIKIVEYTDQGGKRTWGCVSKYDSGDPYRYERVTPYIRGPKVIWERQRIPKK